MADPAPAANTRNHHKRKPSETRNKPKRNKDGADGMVDSGDKGENYYKAGTSVLEQADALLHRAEVKTALRRTGSAKKTKTRYFFVQTNFGRFNVEIIGPEVGPVLMQMLIMGLNQVRLGYDGRAAEGGRHTFKNEQALSAFVSSYSNPVLQTTDDFVQYLFFARTHLKLTPVKVPITKIAFQDIVHEIPVRHRRAHVDEFAIRGVMALLDEDTGGFQAIHPEDLCDESFVPRVRDATELIFDGGESYGIEATPMEGIDITDETAPEVAPEETPLVKEVIVFVETSQYALAKIEGSALTEHRVELPEAEYDEMLLKLDKLQNRALALRLTKQFVCRLPGAQAPTRVTSAATTAPGTAALSAATRQDPMVTPTKGPAASALGNEAGDRSYSPASRMQHALKVSALALAGRTVTPEQIQSEKTAAAAGTPVCLFCVFGSCNHPSKCKRLHRRVLIKSAASSGADVCKFYLGEMGCHNGTSCTFRHFVLPP